MAKFLIKGGKKLEGEVNLSGNKNSALKLMAASLLAEGPSVLTNVPRIRDIEVMGRLIEGLGAKVKGLGTNTLIIDPSSLSSFKLDPELSGRIRASVVLAAPLLSKFGKAVITPPGGDQIGERLLDTHFSMMEKMGISIKRENGEYFLRWTKRKAVDIFLEESSVTATEMGMMLAAGLAGEIKIEDAACEPHVQDLADFLSKMGAKIDGAGTNTLIIKGNTKLRGREYRVIPDHIEGGTFAIAAAISGGRILLKDYLPKHYRMILSYFSDMGIKFKERGKGEIEFLPSKLIAKKRKFQTRPWPGFPTDLMSPFIVLATQTQGTVLCHDWMYEWRIFFVDDLISMGANIFIADPHRVIVSGPTPLYGERLYCKDIRAGMSVILAALTAQGESVVENIEMVERGYENLEGRLKSLGANVKRVDSDDKAKGN